TAKQRITGSRVHRQLIEEGYAVGLSTVRAYLREKRRQASEVYIPLVHRAGDSAQVDFFEVTVCEAGETHKAWKLLIRLMYSGRDFVHLYDRCDQVSFLDGHVRAFAEFGGVPRRLVYDNLSAAVKRRVGLEIELSDRFKALVSHYLYEACFARPGEGHDKGGVEARGRGIRLQHMTPVPEGESLDAISETLRASIRRQAERQRDAEGRTAMERFGEEQGQLRALPAVAFDARKVELVEVSRQAMIRVDRSRYSVKSHWKCLQATVYVGVDDLRVECHGESMTLRKERPGTRNVKYRHYLPELAKKPQAVRQVAPELIAELGSPFDRLWPLLVPRYGELGAARVISRLLGALCDHGQAAVAQALEATLEAQTETAPETAPAPARIDVPEALSRYTIEAADIEDYRGLLGTGSF
ncbi:MAG: IS21 family transposase, partial [Acidobacteriota bacterium]